MVISEPCLDLLKLREDPVIRPVLISNRPAYLFIPSKSCCGTKPFPRAMQFLVMQRTNNW
jgi:hypothetical protein